jgi:hypothetical protein
VLVFTLPFAAVTGGDYNLDGGLGLVRFYSDNGKSELILYEDPSIDHSPAGTGLPMVKNIVGSFTSNPPYLPALGSLTLDPNSVAAGSSSGNTVNYTINDVLQTPEPSVVISVFTLACMSLTGLVWVRRG